MMADESLTSDLPIESLTRQPLHHRASTQRRKNESRATFPQCVPQATSITCRLVDLILLCAACGIICAKAKRGREDEGSSFKKLPRGRQTILKTKFY